MCRQNRSRKYLPAPFKNGFAYYGALRLSPGDRGETQRFAKAAHLCPVKVRSRGRLATFRKMQSPVALELPELLARSHIPQPDRAVARPTDKQGGIRRIETDATDERAAIFSNVSFTGTTLRLSPP